MGQKEIYGLEQSWDDPVSRVGFITRAGRAGAGEISPGY